MMEPEPPPSPPTLPPPYEAEFSPPLPPFAPFEADCYWTAVDISMWVVNFVLPTTASKGCWTSGSRRAAEG